YCVQSPPDWSTVERQMIALYKRMFEKFYAEQALIPEGNLVEVCFEDLVQRPLAVVENIYASLELPGFPEARGDLQRYLASQSDLSHHYAMDEALKARLGNEFHATLERWGYE
ncbi:MAG: sulfotransferase, partial [Thermoplasmatota archaeon]